LKSLIEILSLRERRDIVDFHMDEWNSLKIERHTCIGVVASLNDACHKIYGIHIWADELINSPLIHAYSSIFAVKNFDDQQQLCSHIEALLDMLTIGREIEMLDWCDWQAEQLQRFESDAKDAAVHSELALELMLKGDKCGSDIYDGILQKETQAFRGINEHSVRLDKKYFAKRGKKTKKGWLCSALGDLIPDEYPNKAAFISKLANDLCSTKISRQLARSILKKGYT